MTSFGVAWGAVQAKAAHSLVKFLKADFPEANIPTALADLDRGCETVSVRRVKSGLLAVGDVADGPREPRVADPDVEVLNDDLLLNPAACVVVAFSLSLLTCTNVEYPHNLFSLVLVVRFVFARAALLGDALSLLCEQPRSVTHYHCCASSHAR
jgi:hypothetical protein